MGSRALLVLARDGEAARAHFGVEDGTGRIYTRTGRPFLAPDWEQGVLSRARAAVTGAGLWEALDTGWLVLDAEILPWSLKAGELIRGQYAAVGAAGNAALPAAVAALERAVERGVDAGSILERTRERAADLSTYREAYRAYVRRVEGPGDVRILPFHLLASEGRVHTDRGHLWHLETLGRLADVDPALFGRTAHRVVTLSDPASEAEATAWWEALTASGGEGMVVKPLAFLDPEKRSLQPALKVRGREYLRIIYGPEYTRPEHLARLRTRALGAKRARALREFHLGLEALARFVDRAGTARVHECVLGVLALESDPVDARL